MQNKVDLNHLSSRLLLSAQPDEQPFDSLLRSL